MSHAKKMPDSIEKLRQIVSVMNASEKNVFKRYIRNYKDNNNESNYLQLFDCVNDTWKETEHEMDKRRKQAAIEAESELPVIREYIPAESIFYDKFQTRLRLRKLPRPDQLSSNANYVFNRILEALRANNMDRSDLRDLLSRMVDIQFLYRKGLHEECLKLVYKAQELANKIEAMPHLLELLRLERRLLTYVARINVASTLRRIEAKEAEVMRQIQLITQFQDLYQLTVFVLLDIKRTKTWGEDFLKKIEVMRPYLETPALVDNCVFEVKFYCYTTLCVLIEYSSKYPLAPPIRFQDKRIVYQAKIVELFAAYPRQKDEDPLRHRIAVFNYLNVAVTAGQAIDYEQYADFINTIDPSNPDYLGIYITVNLLRNVTGKAFLEAKKLLETNHVLEMIKVADPEKVSIVRIRMICYHAGLVYFIREDFKKAAIWFEECLKISKGTETNLILIMAELLGLICHYELDKTPNHKLQEYLVSKVSIRLDKKKLLQEGFEKFLISSLRQVLNTKDNETALKKLAIQLLAKGKPLMSSRPELVAYNTYIAWLESKVQNKGLRMAIDMYL
jgi:hypothetical protein